MFKLLAEILEELLGGRRVITKKQDRKTVIWVLFLITEGGTIAGVAGLFGFGTVGRVLCGLGAVWLPIDFKVNPWYRD